MAGHRVISPRPPPATVERAAHDRLADALAPASPAPAPGIPPLHCPQQHLQHLAWQEGGRGAGQCKQGQQRGLERGFPAFEGRKARLSGRAKGESTSASFMSNERIYGTGGVVLREAGGRAACRRGAAAGSSRRRGGRAASRLHQPTRAPRALPPAPRGRCREARMPTRRAAQQLQLCRKVASAPPTRPQRCTAGLLCSVQNNS
jgi:hypothetical protein